LTKIKKNMIGYIELSEGKLEIQRVANGRDLLQALQSQAKGGGFITSLIANLCTLDGSKLTAEMVEEFDAGVSLAIQEAIFETKTLVPEDVENFPKTYRLGEKTIVLNEPRKIKHDNKAARFANGDNSTIVFWLMSFLISVDGRLLQYDDLLDLPAGEVQALMDLVTPKKSIFVPVKA
jgi:hypothetical protein